MIECGGLTARVSWRPRPSLREEGLPLEAPAWIRGSIVEAPRSLGAGGHSKDEAEGEAVGREGFREIRGRSTGAAGGKPEDTGGVRARELRLDHHSERLRRVGLCL